MTTPPKKPEPTWPDDDKPEPPDDRILTIRVSPELYEIVVSEAKAAKHSINSAATILLEEALGARGKWEAPKDKEPPFWRRPTKGKTR